MNLEMRPSPISIAFSSAPASKTPATAAASTSRLGLASLVLWVSVLLLPWAAIAAPAQADPPALPADSLYQLDAEFSDQTGRKFQLSDRVGKPQLVAMFYTTCRYVCPLIIDSAKGVEHALPEAERSDLQVLLVSMDPERDDTAALQRVFERRRLDAPRWTLARTDQGEVRKLAALLGVRYRALADGEFNHTSSLYLLDAQGRKVAETQRLGAEPDAEFMQHVRQLLGARGLEP